MNRPFERGWHLPALLWLSVVSAIAGGAELLVWPRGNRYVPESLLHGTAFSSFVVPGLLLMLIVGGSSLGAAVLASRRSAYANDATLLAGGVLTFFIADEIAILRTLHPLHALYGALGVTILALGIREAWRRDERRARWTVSVTLAEAVGFLVPASVGIAAFAFGVPEAWHPPMLVLAGGIEGALCGLGQAVALPVAIDRPRFVFATACGAALTWSIAMGLVALAHAEVAPPLVAIAFVVGGTIGLASMGTAQALVLRRSGYTAGAWVIATVLGWTCALPWSFAPSPLVDETTPLVTHLVLWPSAGVAMAYVMAIVTWQGARRIAPRSRGD